MIRLCRKSGAVIRAVPAFSLCIFALCFAPALCADAGSTAARPAQNSSSTEINQLKAQVQQALQDIQSLKTKLDSAAASPAAAKDLQQQVDAELAHVRDIEQRLDAIEHPSPSPPDPSPVSLVAGRGPETMPGVTTGLAPADIYNSGFFVSTGDKSYSMYVNGLFQIRYTGFKPQNNVQPLGASSAGTNNFDVFLGRLAVSGTAFDPTWKYFLQFQGSTAGDGNGISMLDWFTSKTFSPRFTVQVGRFWTPYSYEYYDNPGNYLFADLSTAEYAFVLPRAIGVEAFGQAGRLGYAAMVGNSVRALDAAGQENFNSRVAVIGNLHYDILAPYGWVETDPSADAAPKPELTFWISAAYNPVASPSAFENVNAGDKTINATSTLGFRDQRFTAQLTGYFRQTTAPGSAVSDNSWGYGEQAGYYLVPGRFEIAERITGVNWGGLHFALPPSPDANTYFAGPDFPYHRTVEHTIGVNYYLHGHNAKIQAAYTYQNGNTFTAAKFGASRVWLQTQLMF